MSFNHNYFLFFFCFFLENPESGSGPVAAARGVEGWHYSTYAAGQ